jgi:D-alanyl-D-alanine carboxypeptidase/D-alanyl-D-alanine-endopeptidase (penicillin-binding protein 4)
MIVLHRPASSALDPCVNSATLGPMPRLSLLVLLLLASVRPAPGASLDDRLDELLAAVPAGGLAGVAVADLEQRKWIYQRKPDLPLRLASTTKLVVAAAALLGLGPDYQFHTRLVGLGPLANGSLPGLGVIGGGSPCLDEHFATAGDPDNFFKEWALELRRQGVARIAGDLVIDNRLFSGPIRPATYPQDPENQQRWFSAPASAFAWNDNCIEVRLLPTRPGQPSEVQTRPASARIRIQNQTRTVASGGQHSVARDLASNTVIVSGTCGRPTAWFPLAIQGDPDLVIGDHLKRLLVQGGVPVDGEVRLGAVDPAAGPLLLDLRQPLVPAVELMNQHSQNFYGEQLLRLLGVAQRQEGSLAAGRAATLDILRQTLGETYAQVELLDGCGLSYDNRASATTMVNLLDAMHRTPLRQAFYGSLKERNAANGVKGRVKTGTLAVASCLAGYIDTSAGNRYAFAVLLNLGESSSFGWADRLRWKVFETLCAGLR